VEVDIWYYVERTPRRGSGNSCGYGVLRLVRLPPHFAQDDSGGAAKQKAGSSLCSELQSQYCVRNAWRDHRIYCV